MENDTPATAEPSFETQLGELREHPAYMDGMHPQHKDINEQITDLYKKHSSSQGDNAEPSGDVPKGMPKPSNEPPDLATEAQAELDKLAELGVDVSNEDIVGVTPDRIEGFKHLRLIEEGNFDELGASLSSAAFRVGRSVDEVSMLHGFLRKAQPNDELAKDILRAIAEHIYRNRTR